MNPRDELVDYLRRQLVGPAQGEEEVLDAPPDRQYLMGTLYPQEADLQRRLTETAEELEGPGTEDAADDTAPATDPIPESNSWLPSSLGFSFYTDASTLEVVCGAARYETRQGDRARHWRRVPLPVETVTVGPDEQLREVLGGRAQIRIRRRAFGGGRLVTVALVNAAHAGAPAAGRGRAAQWDRMLFQVRLEARPLDGGIRPYPSVRLASRDPEEQELRLQYRHVVTHAVGHGCAVDELHDGEGGEGGNVVGVAATVMPRSEVPATRAAGPVGLPVLRVSHLSDPAVPRDVLRGELEEFAAGYRRWYAEQRAAEVPGWGREAADRILDRVGTVVGRIESGIRTLCDPERPELLEAFRTANHAMALQMRHSAPDQAGGRRSRGDAAAVDPAPFPDAAWRPFQLAFFLMAVDGTVDPRHPDRETADLIWFPTGGGKTEAYLLLAAFVMVLRRREPDGGGTAVLSRYTLSLLTTQQFQRAATTVCALETLRRADPAALGTEPFSIGLWVGEATSPNSYKAARDAFDDVRAAARPEDVFILDRCPWCGTRVLPARKSPDIADYGVRAGADSFAFFCPRDACAFHDELPVAVVDEHLYDRPPTFVLGTVDKFARLAWEPRAGRLFGDGGRTAPPSLVIQDELHLLTGPLGTTVGLYEAAVLGLCERNGVGPKVVASTATIRRSEEQVRGLYGRAVQLFPPAGTDARHSYFAEPDTSRPGRQYVGVMAQGHTAGRAAVTTAAAMLQGAWELPEEHRDAYWTLVAYHHSLRELGRTVTAAADDIPAQLAGLDGGRGTRELPDRAVQELTSNLARAEQPVLLDRLEKPYTAADAVAFLPCTNMLSVGVDVKRLALMLMQGQPKTTAEYIQATSRVGRHAVPGLVVTFFNATRPRDRSHYETFDVYHRSLYRHVEPTSVTPWSAHSRRRALHAALVILVRHGLGLSAENQAGELVDRLPEVVAVAERLAARAAAGDPRAAAEVHDELDALLSAWQQHALDARKEGKELYYRSQGKGQMHLLKNFERHGGLWETPHSMRNVDRECQVTVKGAEL
ncbi:helicase-related protein [Streptomyces sp. NPDC002262]|uniref:helicase-related protein n=1 Tax=Streptomyces sp. NPDC002262 TaxID=3154414 RepID=UPI00332F9229